MIDEELYDFAVKAAADFGWVLNLGLTGHRFSDLPHKAHCAGRLGPNIGIFVTELLT